MKRVFSPTCRRHAHC